MERDKYVRRFMKQNSGMSYKESTDGNLSDIKNQINQAKITVNNLKLENTTMNKFMGKILNTEANPKYSDTNYSLNSPTTSKNSPTIIYNQNFAPKTGLDTDTFISNYILTQSNPPKYPQNLDQNPIYDMTERIQSTSKNFPQKNPTHNPSPTIPNPPNPKPLNSPTKSDTQDAPSLANSKSITINSEFKIVEASIITTTECLLKDNRNALVLFNLFRQTIRI
jgi:hypothetical protein